MSDELLVIRKGNKIITARTENSRIVQLEAEEAEEAGILGNIYIGKVKNIVKNINAAFVEFQKGQMGYLPLGIKQCPVHTGARYQEGRVIIGDEIIVQVEREAIKTKPPALTGILSIPGRYIVLVSESYRNSVSSKIRDKDARKRLSEINSSYASEDYGFIARTNSADASTEEIINEIEMLIKKYKDIVSFGMHKTIFSCLYSAPAGYLNSVINSYNGKLGRILTDDQEIYNNIKIFLEERGLTLISKLELWDSANGKLEAVYNIPKTLERALMPKVWLKSGAYIIIQPAEALVAIDVNTGKAVSKKKDVQKTFLKTNIEAAKEIAVQIRLRNLSGIIIIDFIDMEDEESNKALMDCLRAEFAKDSIQTKLVDMTKLGLIEVTRKKTKKPLYMQML
ncbi:MAG: ribonuclease E/G [Lachnospiraceae bacterium]|nr:ribonuclease E/G [Lachnospiraceae bacterium]